MATTDGNAPDTGGSGRGVDRRMPMLAGAGAGLVGGLVPAGFFPPIAVLTVPVGVVGGMIAGLRWAER